MKHIDGNDKALIFHSLTPYIHYICLDAIDDSSTIYDVIATNGSKQKRNLSNCPKKRITLAHDILKIESVSLLETQETCTLRITGNKS